jgi:hypothetical protein
LNLTFVLIAALLSVFALPAQAESACSRTIRDAFDRAGLIAAKPGDSELSALEASLRARPSRCEPGDYATFIRRYADLLLVMGAQPLTDNQRRLAAAVRVLAPQRVASSDYDAAFRGFISSRARLSLQLPPDHAADLLALFDEVRPVEILPAVALGRDRDGVIQGLAEIRRQLALGQVADADALAAELLDTLQAEPQPADGGASDGGT